MKEIADHLGLSLPTVSQVLNGKGRIGAATRELVWKAAEELGYRPNAAAKAVSTGRFGCLALLLGEGVSGNLDRGLIEGIHDALAEHDMHLTITKIPDQQLTDAGYVPKLLRINMVDGMLVNYKANVPQRMVQLFKQAKLPAIWISSKRRTDCVYNDNINAARQLTAYLLGLGHKRIAYVDYRRGQVLRVDPPYAVEDRRKGYLAALQDVGLPPIEIPAADEPPIEGRLLDYSMRWLSKPNRPTAIVAMELSMAWPIILAARSLGLCVPGDLSVATFSSLLPFDIGMKITSMLIPDYESGRTAVQLMLEKLETGAPVKSVCTRFTLEPGETTAPPRP